MTKEIARACRLFAGYTTKLNCKLPTDTNNPTVYETTIQSLIIDHIFAIYGIGIFEKLGCSKPTMPIPGVDVEDYMKMLEFAGEEARKACACEFDLN